MDQYLIIQIDEFASRASWLPADGSGRPLGLAQHGTLADAAAMAADRRACVVVPAERVLLTRVALPAGRKQWLQAVPYALEERLTDDVETLHFAIGRDTGPDGAVPVAALSRTQMESWLQALHAAGIEPWQMVPDCLALPWEPGQATIAVDGARTLCRDGACDGFACESALFQPFYDARDRRGGAEWAKPPAPRTLNVEAGLLSALAPGAVAAPLNLLQGEFARRRPGLQLGRWRLAAALAAAWVVLAGGNWLFGFVALEREHRALRAAIETEFRGMLPNEPMTDNPRAQIERRLEGRAADGGEWLHMLDTLSAAVPRVAGVELQSITWRPGTMDVSLAAQRAEQLDELRGHIAAGGQEATIESASSRGDRVDGRVRIRSGR